MICQHFTIQFAGNIQALPLLHQRHGSVVTMLPPGWSASPHLAHWAIWVWGSLDEAAANFRKRPAKPKCKPMQRMSCTSQSNMSRCHRWGTAVRWTFVRGSYRWTTISQISS